MLSRRGLIGSLAGLIAAPAVVKASSLMRISAPPLVYPLRDLAYSFAITKEIYAANIMDRLNVQKIDETYMKYAIGYTDPRGIW